MKGVTGNLSLNSLYRACCVLTEKLRANDFDDISAEFNKVYAIYEEIVEAIHNAAQN